MSKLLKSKFLLGVMIVAVMAVGAFVLNTNTASAETCSTGTTTLRVGSRGAAVVCLQTALDSGIVADGIFGPKTKARVVAWQAANGLVADGLFGAKSRAVLVANGGVSGQFAPAGCQSASGYSPVTGGACYAIASGAGLPAGCSSTTGFSATTGQACNGGVTVNNGPVAVALAANNPASGTLVAAQATADLAHFTFTGTGTVTGITLQRLGVSGDATLSNVYLFDGATRLTDAASVSNNGTVTFNVPAGIFTVNGSKTISVKSDILTGTSGQTVGVMLSTFTTATGTVNANLSGNLFNIASATLAAVSAGTVTPSGATINPAANVTVWQSTLSISQRDVWMKRLALRNVGSAPATAFQNFKLYVNGVVVGTATGLDVNGYVTFDLNAAPVLLVAGSRVVRVDVDIVSGASRTVQFSLRQASDVDFVDSSYGVNITPTTTPWAPGSASTISGTTGGSLTVEKDVSSPSTNLTLNGSDINLGTFKLTAYGESIKLETLKAGFTYTDVAGGNGAGATLRNGRLMINGVQYGSTATLLAAGTSFTTNYTIVPGTPVLVEVHADIYDNDGTDDIDATDTLKAQLVLGSSNATRVDSLGSFNVPAVATVDANTRTVATTSVTLSKNSNYAAQNTALPATNFKIGSYNLAGSSVEDVLLTTITVDVNNTSGTDFLAGDVTNMYVVVKDSNGNIVAQPAPLGTVVAASNSYSINYTLAKNTNLTLEVFGNLADDSTPTAIEATNAITTTMQIAGTSMVSGQSVTSGDHAGNTIVGQAIAYNAATLTVSKDASTPVAAIVYDNQTVTTLAAKFAAVTAGYNVTNLTITVGTSADTVVQNVMLYDGSTLIASGPLTTTTTAVFSGLNWNIPANTNKILTVKLQLGNIGVGAGTSGATITTSIANVAVAAGANMKATNTSTGVDTATSTEETGSAAGNAINAFASIPTIAKVALADNNLLNTAGRPLLKFTITSNGGDVAWGRLFFDTSNDAATALASTASTGVTLWDTANNTEIQGVFLNATNFVGSVATTGSIKFTPTDEQVISGSKTYELRGTITSADAAGDFVTVTLANDSSAYVAIDALATIYGADADAPIVWSDMSASSHTVLTGDWTSDFGVKSLPVSDSLNWPF